MHLVVHGQDSQINPFDKFVSKAPKFFSLSIDLFHFLSISRRPCFVLKPFRKPHGSKTWFQRT